jgi:hypothetical protein
LSSPGSTRQSIPKADQLSFVMPGLVPGIHVFIGRTKDVDGRDKPGHDESG